MYKILTIRTYLIYCLNAGLNVAHQRAVLSISLYSGVRNKEAILIPSLNFACATSSVYLPPLTGTRKCQISIKMILHFLILAISFESGLENPIYLLSMTRNINMWIPPFDLT
jgi:hypothetical protein